MKKVFIDGSAGTTGLRIHERLAGRADLEILTLSEETRKDPAARKEMLNEADIAFLCLPDDAAREAVAMIENPNTVVLDTSTAHRTLPGWCYGFPELSEEKTEEVKNAKRIAVPGCHASGFIALVAPLIKAGALPKEALLTCHSVTGYSGGGKKMIADYEGEETAPLLKAPRQYALGQQHKHLKEMTAITGLKNSPIFCPIVSDFYSGMAVTVPLFASQLNEGFGFNEIKKIYQKQYQSGLVSFKESADEGGFFSAAGLSDRDRMEVSVCGNEERILLLARYDNLGKGASGAALECMNLVLGVPAETGLEI
ncbi:MAG: N-acetyl-gamma-glutamyl-phosphate reductase [Clostridia bacterium]|nr:N-acetyl-gamma-glutamyl-phosphate reductase [Clostridia bacterium]